MNAILSKFNNTKQFSKMETLIKEISEGKHNGKSFWICDLRYLNGYYSKPIRNVPPTFAEVSDTSDKDNVYYSDSSFFVKSKMIKLYDNTGYRGRTGTALRVFENKEDCVAHYNAQIELAVKSLEKDKETRVSEICELIEKFKDLKR